MGSVELTLLPLTLVLVYLALHSALVLCSPGPLRTFALAVDLALFAGFLALFWTLQSPGSAWLTFLALWGPIIFFWFGYLWAGQTLNAFHPPDYTLDGPLVRFEGKYLGQPTLHWARRGAPWINELAHVFYFTYYFYTPVLGIYLYSQQRYQEFECVSFAVLFGYCVSYTLFAITPAWGPRWALVHFGLLDPSEQRPQGFFITRLTYRIMWDGLAHKGGAMPSSHSSTAVVFLIWSARLWGLEGGAVAAVLVAGMWLGSIYGRYHFVLDILIGGILGGAGILLADFLVGCWA